MRRLAGALMILALLAGASVARAEFVLDRIQRTGVFNVGASALAMPFSYRNSDGQLIGFTIDLLRAIHQHLEKHLERPIKLQWHEVQASNRLQRVMEGTVDLVCAPTPTWSREVQVDFSIPFFISGIRIMTLQNAISRMQDLPGKRIGVSAGTINARTLIEHVPEAIPVELPAGDSGFERFSRGELDGLAHDHIVLRALLEDNPLKSAVVLLPRSGVLAREASVCILPQNDSAWRDFVNHSLAELLTGVDKYQGAYMDIYERWFGPRGVLYLPLDYGIAQQLAGSLIWLY